MAKDKGDSPDEILVFREELEEVFTRILLSRNFSKGKAKVCAGVFVENSLDGVYSHGVYRFPRFIEYIEKGYVKIEEEASICQKIGAIEQWDGLLACR